MSSKKRKLRSTSSHDIKDRGDDGRFMKKCGCENHLNWSHIEVYTVFDVKRSNKYAKTIISKMRLKGVLTPKSMLLCTSCYMKFKSL